MSTLQVKGYSAGIMIFTEQVDEETFYRFLERIRSELAAKRFTITLCGAVFPILELCYDVYRNNVWQADLSRSLKA